MSVRIQIVCHETIDEGFLAQIRLWGNEVIERISFPNSVPVLHLLVWKNMDEYLTFSRSEKEALGVVTGEESEFLATHDAWRGYPRIHICQERLMAIPNSVIQGVIHHEIAHALNHGTLEFYTFTFSKGLQEAARSRGLDMPHLQQCVYFLSVAIKDREAVSWLARIGLGFSQAALLRHLISETEEERQAWEVVRDSGSLRKIAFAAFLKVLLPLETLAATQTEEAKNFRKDCDEAYGWLPGKEREGLLDLAHRLMSLEGGTFQERLERATFLLINADL
ncbi:MAG: hypothetical protein ABSF48_20155 [Thermodesulfobacteriota bacterium]